MHCGVRTLYMFPLPSPNPKMCTIYLLHKGASQSQAKEYTRIVVQYTSSLLYHTTSVLCILEQHHNNALVLDLYHTCYLHIQSVIFPKNRQHSCNKVSLYRTRKGGSYTNGPVRYPSWAKKVYTLAGPCVMWIRHIFGTEEVL